MKLRIELEFREVVMDNTQEKLKLKIKCKDRVKLSFDCTKENYSQLVAITKKAGYNRNELINILLAFGVEHLEIEE